MKFPPFLFFSLLYKTKNDNNHNFYFFFDFTWIFSISLEFSQFLLSFLKFPRLYSILPDFSQFSLYFINFPRLFSVFIDISQFSLTFLNFPWVLSSSCLNEKTKQAMYSCQKIIFPVWTWKWKRSQRRHLCPSVFRLIAMKLRAVSCLSLSRLSCCFILS